MRYPAGREACCLGDDTWGDAGSDRGADRSVTGVTSLLVGHPGTLEDSCAVLDRLDLALLVVGAGTDVYACDLRAAENSPRCCVHRGQGRELILGMAVGQGPTGPRTRGNYPSRARATRPGESIVGGRTGGHGDHIVRLVEESILNGHVPRKPGHGVEEFQAEHPQCT